MRTLTLTLDDSPEAETLIRDLRASPHVQQVREEVKAPNGKVLPLLWIGEPETTIAEIFGEPPIEKLRPLAEIRQGWNKRNPFITGLVLHEA